MSDTLDAQALARLRELGDEDFLVEVIDLFLADAPAQLSAIHEGLGRLDAEAVRVAAHALKGAAANVGARTVAATADALDRLGRGGALDDAADLVAALGAELDAATAALLAERQRASDQRG